ncbi:MAG: rod shape-determining protein MreD [Acidobacteriota bacterium]
MLALRFILGLLLAIVVYVMALWASSAAGRFFDPFLVLVLYHAIRSSPASSALGGSVAGLVHDSFTGGLYGLHGFANTLTAALATALKQRFVIQRPAQVALLFLLGAAIQTATATLLQFVMVPGADLQAPADRALSSLLTCTLGTLVYVVSGRFFSW